MPKRLPPMPKRPQLASPKRTDRRRNSNERVRPKEQSLAAPAFSLPAMGYDGRMKRTILLAAALLLTACGERDTDPGPGGVTVGEARALDEAAEMIEARRLPEEALATGTPSPSPTASPSAAATE
jgi:hypothetical protein